MLTKYFLLKTLQKKLSRVNYLSNYLPSTKLLVFSLHFKITKNNIFANFSNSKNKVLLTYSSGQLKKDSKKLPKQYFGEYLTLILKNFNAKNLLLTVNGGSTYLRKLIFVNFIRYSFNILSIVDKTKLPHNGCKLKKQQRVN
jgi:small subunit ribosomal protein S11